MLRHVVHVLIEQLKAENRKEPLGSILPEAFFALNVLNHYGGATPYQAVFGRHEPSPAGSGVVGGAARPFRVGKGVCRTPMMLC